MGHVRALAALGDRVAGTKREATAAGYIKAQMERAGLHVTVEPFRFTTFALESAVLTAGRDRVKVLRLAVNPYSGGRRRTGKLAFVESFDSLGPVLKQDLDGKIVVTADSRFVGGRARFLSIFKKPLAIASVSKADFDTLQKAGAVSGALTFRGKMVKLRSANIVGSEPSATAAIVLSAHYDSWKGPGANDNASGVAVLLELARYFRSHGAPVRFVAFGAEEIGLLGSKAYLERHRSALRDCKLLFNINTVGGDEGIVAEARGYKRPGPAPVETGPEPPGKAITDLDARWVLLGFGQNALTADSTVPDWLQTAFAETAKELKLEIGASSGMGSDHRVFEQAGITATDISSGGDEIHSAADLPESVRPRSLENAARIVIGIVARATPAE